MLLPDLVQTNLQKALTLTLMVSTLLLNATTASAIESVSPIIPLIRSGELDSKLGGAEEVSDVRGKIAELFRHGKYAECLQICEEALKDDPKNVNLLGLKALAHLGLGENEKALGDLTVAISAQPTGNLYRLRGRIYRALRQYDKAMEDFNRGLVLEVSSPLLLERAQTSRDKGDFYSALADTMLALELDKTSGEALVLRVQLFQDVNQDKLALNYLQKGIEVAPDSAPLLTEFGNYYYSHRQDKEAVEYYTKAIAANPDNAGTYRLRALSESNQQKYDEALADVEKAFILEENSFANFSTRARVYGQAQKFDKSLKDSNAAIALNPNDASSYAMRALAFGALHKPAEQIADLNKALELEPKSQMALIERAQYYIDKSKWKEAFDDLTTLIKANENATNYARRAATYILHGDYDKAESDIDQAVKLDPSDVHYKLLKAELLRSQKRYDDAIAECDKIIAEKDADGSAYCLKGDLEIQKKDYKKAVECYTKSLSLESKAVTLVHRSEAYEGLREYQNALDDLSKAIEQKPNEVDAYYSRSRLYRTQKKFDFAIADANKAVELAPHNSAVLQARVWTRVLRHDYEDALKDSNTMLEINPSAIAWVCRGDAHVDLGQFTEGVKDYEEAFKADPKDPNALQGMAKAMMCLHHYPKALVYAKDAVQKGPDDAGSYWELGLASMMNHQDNQAEKAFEKGLTLTPELTEMYSELAVWTVYSQLLAENKVNWLTDGMKDKIVKGDWPYAIVQYLDGTKTSEQLLESATDDDQRTEAHCAIGVKMLADKNKTDAKKHFAWVEEKGNKGFIEYRFAEWALRL